MLIKNFTRHGNSSALVLDKPILELLNFDPEGLVGIATDGVSLVVSPVRSPEDNAKFEAAIAKGHKKYGKMLKKLAE